MEQPLLEDHYHYTDLPIYEITPEEVFTVINKLDINKANGPDCISAYMLKATAGSIASPLAKLFNLSLTTGKFPQMWKTASIVLRCNIGKQSVLFKPHPRNLQENKKGVRYDISQDIKKHR